MSTPLRLAIGIDIGGTKIAAGVVDSSGEVAERFEPVATPSSDQEAMVKALDELVADLRLRHPKISAVGVGAAGLVDWPSGHIRWAPNNSYRNMPLRELLEQTARLPVVVDNDANVAAWAEMCAGPRSDCMAFLTVGTGVGGGLVLDGRLYRGKTGIAAEVGHLIVDPLGEYRCGCGNVGCLEAVGSGSALGLYGQEAAAVNPTGLMATLAGGPELVTGRIVHQAALQADAEAIRQFDRVGFWLGVGAASLVNVCDFDVVVVGGGLGEAGDLVLGPMRAAFLQFLFAKQHREVPRIVPASLGADAGWIGAGLLALSETCA